MATARLRPVAAPTDTFVSGRLPGPKTRDVSGLVRGLGNLSGSLRRLGETQDRVQEAEDLANAESNFEKVKGNKHLTEILKLQPELTQDVVSRFEKAGVKNLNPFAFSLLKRLEGRDWVRRSGYAESLKESVLDRAASPDFEGNVEDEMDKERARVFEALPSQVSEQFQQGILEEMRPIDQDFRKAYLREKDARSLLKRETMVSNEVGKAVEMGVSALRVGSQDGFDKFVKGVTDVLTAHKAVGGEKLQQLAIRGIESALMKQQDVDPNFHDHALLWLENQKFGPVDFTTAEGRLALEEMDFRLDRRARRVSSDNDRREQEAKETLTNEFRAYVYQNEGNTSREALFEKLTSEEFLGPWRERAEELGVVFDIQLAASTAAFVRSMRSSDSDTPLEAEIAKKAETDPKAARQMVEGAPADQLSLTQRARLYSFIEDRAASPAQTPEARREFNQVVASEITPLYGLLPPEKRGPLGGKLSAEALKFGASRLEEVTGGAPATHQQLSTVTEEMRTYIREHPLFKEIQDSRTDITPDGIVTSNDFNVVRRDLEQFFEGTEGMERYLKTFDAEQREVNAGINHEGMERRRILEPRFLGEMRNRAATMLREEPFRSISDIAARRRAIVDALRLDAHQIYKELLEPETISPDETPEADDVSIYSLNEFKKQVKVAMPEGSQDLRQMRVEFAKDSFVKRDLLKQPLTDQGALRRTQFGGLIETGPLSPYHFGQETLGVGLKALQQALGGGGATREIGITLLNRFDPGRSLGKVSLGGTRFSKKVEMQWSMRQVEAGVLREALQGRFYKGPRISRDDLAQARDEGDTEKFHKLLADWHSQSLPRNTEVLKLRAQAALMIEGLTPDEIRKGESVYGPLAVIYGKDYRRTIQWESMRFFTDPKAMNTYLKTAQANPESPQAEFFRSILIDPQDPRQLMGFAKVQELRISKDLDGLRRVQKGKEFIENAMKDRRTYPANYK